MSAPADMLDQQVLGLVDLGPSANSLAGMPSRELDRHPDLQEVAVGEVDADRVHRSDLAGGIGSVVVVAPPPGTAESPEPDP